MTRGNGTSVLQSGGDNPPTPRSVAIVAMGASHAEFNMMQMTGNIKQEYDQTWGVNLVYRAVPNLDVLFIMDDLEALVDDPEQENWIRELPKDIPIITSTAYPEWPNSISYPIAEVCAQLKFAYFNTTIAYAVGFALYSGVQRIGLFGCDFTYPVRRDAENGRACCEFWLGVGGAAGVQFVIAKGSTLLDTQSGRPLYGYLASPQSAGVPFLNVDRELSIPCTMQGIDNAVETES